MGRARDQKMPRGADRAPALAARCRARLARHAGTVLIAAVLVGVATLVVVTPSAGSAESRTRDWISAHHAGPPLTALPSRVATAVIAAEDHRFYQHHGIDTPALARAAGGVLTGRDAGGSTIEIQLAKLLYTGGRHRLSDQVEQATLAVKLDRAYTKNEILLMYLDSEYFGHGFYGVTAAARGYFGAAPQDLTWGQAALVAGLLKAPSYDDPLRHPDRALARRSEVVDRLRAVGVLTAAQAFATDRTTLQLAAVQLSVRRARPGSSTT